MLWITIHQIWSNPNSYHSMYENTSISYQLKRKIMGVDSCLSRSKTTKNRLRLIAFIKVLLEDTVVIFISNTQHSRYKIQANSNDLVPDFCHSKHSCLFIRFYVVWKYRLKIQNRSNIKFLSCFTPTSAKLVVYIASALFVCSTVRHTFWCMSYLKNHASFGLEILCVDIW